MQPMYPQAVSHGNVLSFTPPGFKQCLNVKFPDSRLAVCAKCKKNYKTRDSCRVRSGHTTAPWTTAYICITLDQSCTTAEGDYIDAPLTIRMVQWQPFSVKADFDIKTPVCAACKKTNRTRSFCRARHKHRQLPWCTVFVLLSAVESTDPSTVVAAPSRPVLPGNENEDTLSDGNNEKLTEEKTDEPFPLKGVGGDEETSTSTPVYEVTASIKSAIQPKKEDDITSKIMEEVYAVNKPSSTDEEKKVVVDVMSNADVISAEVDPEGDNINDIDASRTFLVKVSTQSISVHWLELGGEGYANSDSEVKALNDAIRSPTMSMPPLVDPSRYYAQMGASFGFPFQQAQLYPMWGAQQAQYNQQMMQWCGSGGQMAHGAAGQMAPAIAPIIKADTDGDGETSSTKIEEESGKSEVNHALTSRPVEGAAALQAQASPQELWQAQVMFQHQIFYAHQQHVLGQMMTKKPGEKPETEISEHDSASDDQEEGNKKRQRTD
eukprot:CAMPEP_0198252794 /NCGR_PEP_ID=MMETSP1447-20131203/3263_1 /TAXON_ID=420782 /ORGANISM="Chaetoceros dichaeta, Strain CCMP1751" /LENGTH=491 /DNA_ID=CAMNT_0043938179 /DNA_START=78 /DNA_END=1553 /DNA_ORIENTATION=-